MWPVFPFHVHNILSQIPKGWDISYDIFELCNLCCTNAAQFVQFILNWQCYTSIVMNNHDNCVLVFPVVHNTLHPLIVLAIHRLETFALNIMYIDDKCAIGFSIFPLSSRRQNNRMKKLDWAKFECKSIEWKSVLWNQQKFRCWMCK